MKMIDRKRIADDLMVDCPCDAAADHQKVASAILRGDEPSRILAMPELDNWPESYHWLKTQMQMHATAKKH